MTFFIRTILLDIFATSCDKQTNKLTNELKNIGRRFSIGRPWFTSFIFFYTLLLSQMVPKELFFILPYKILWSSAIGNILILYLRRFFQKKKYIYIFLAATCSSVTLPFRPFLCLRVSESVSERVCYAEMSQKTALFYKNIIRNAKLRKLTSVDLFYSSSSSFSNGPQRTFFYLIKYYEALP